MKNKIGYLPKDRDVEALALNDSIYNNIALASINNIFKNLNVLFLNVKKVKLLRTKLIIFKSNVIAVVI
ncbi:MAG: hypothetical protein L6U99_05005 [Clostridium sp.]|nr:MAG: hypothetical protein L6U99_05005 [Clostridium sp.]